MNSRLGRIPILTLLLACSAIACADHQASRPAAAARATARLSAAVPAPGSTLAKVPYYLDPAEQCQLLESSVFPDPVALMNHFVERDNAGDFVNGTPVQDSVYACPGHLGGTDEFSVVRRSVLEPGVQTRDSATFFVRSEMLGFMRQDSVAFHFDADPLVAVDTYHVVRTPYGWRVESPEAAERVLGSRLLVMGDSLVRIHPEARDSLGRVLGRR